MAEGSPLPIVTNFSIFLGHLHVMEEVQHLQLGKELWALGGAEGQLLRKLRRSCASSARAASSSASEMQGWGVESATYMHCSVWAQLRPGFESNSDI